MRRVQEYRTNGDWPLELTIDMFDQVLLAEPSKHNISAAHGGWNRSHDSRVAVFFFISSD